MSTSVGNWNLVGPDQMDRTDDALRRIAANSKERRSELQRLTPVLEALDRGLRAAPEGVPGDLPPATQIQPDARDDLFGRGEP